MKDHLDLKAYAKINLGLDVIRKREDGYHEVRMIMQTVNLYDRIEMDRTEDGVIRTETNLPFVPDGEGNLAWRAAKLLLDEKGIKDGVTIKIRKYIPVAAGMAGGSTDAAAVLVGVNLMSWIHEKRAYGAGGKARRGCSVLYHAWNGPVGRNR